VASRFATPGDSPDEGGVTLKSCDADAPGATVPSDTAPDGDTFQPSGTLSDTADRDRGRLVGLRKVARTVNVPWASAEDEMAASVGCGADGGP
jgi:hypothetical protein